MIRNLIVIREQETADESQRPKTTRIDTLRAVFSRAAGVDESVSRMKTDLRNLSWPLKPLSCCCDISWQLLNLMIASHTIDLCVWF